MLYGVAGVIWASPAGGGSDLMIWRRWASQWELRWVWEQGGRRHLGEASERHLRGI